MKISIVTVCLNTRETIEKTFLSIFNQTSSDWELLVVDGCSTDGTIDLINKYRDKISYFVSEPDNGVYNAMNKAIPKATGDFIMFLNSNDVFNNVDVIKNVILAVQSSPQAKFLYGDINYVDEKGQILENKDYSKINESFYTFFINNNINHQAIFYHKDLFKEYGLYDENFKIISDYIFNYKCLVQEKVTSLFIPVIISDFLLGGLCTNKKFRKIQDKEYKFFVKKFYKKYYPAFVLDKFFKKWFHLFYKLFKCPFSVARLVEKNGIKLIKNNSKILDTPPIGKC